MDVASQAPAGHEATAGRQRLSLIGLDPRAYEHDADRRALDALEGTPGMEKLVTWLNRHAIERIFRIQYVGSNIKMTSRNLPELHRALQDACELIHLQQMPDLYIQEGDSTSAVTVGVEHPLIVLNKGCVESSSAEELLFIIAREVGHIKSQHVLYGQIAEFLPGLGEVIGAAMLGLGDLVTTSLKMTILHWRRMSEYTADRAGLLACQDMGTAISVLMKQAGLPKKYATTFTVDEFIAQAREFQGYDVNKGDKFVKFLSILGQERPWTIVRAFELLRWMERGDYDRLIAAHTCHGGMDARGGLGVEPPAVGRYCTHCGMRFSGTDRFCTQCGAQRE